MNMVTQARRAPYACVDPPGEANPGPGANAWLHRHAVRQPHTTRRQNAGKMARGPGACATTCTPARTRSLRTPGGRQGAPLPGADGPARDRARGDPPRPAAGAATSPRTARAAARPGHTPGRLGHLAAYTIRRHCGHANRDTAGRQSSGPSASSPKDGPLHVPAICTRTRAPPDPLAPLAPPHTPARHPDAETTGASPPAPAPSA